MKKTIALIAVLALVFAGCTSGKPGSDESSLPEASFIPLGDWSFKANGHSVLESVKVTGNEKREDGFIFVKVNITFRNETQQQRAFMAGMFTMELEDSTGSSSMNELFVEGGLDTADVKAKGEISGDFFFKMQGNLGTNPAGMKLKMMNIGQAQSPKAEYILK